MPKIESWSKIDEGIWQKKGTGYPILDKTVWISSNNMVNISEGKFRVSPLEYENRTPLKKARTSKEATKFAVAYMKSHSKGKMKGWNVCEKAPKGWILVTGATTVPTGYRLYSNGKSRFGGQRKTCLVKIKNL